MKTGRRCYAFLVAGLPFASLALSNFAFAGEKARSAPLTLEKAMPIPGIPTGPYSDGIALDVAGGRVFATPQAGNAVAVLDLNGRKVLRMIPGFGQLHGVYYDRELQRLFVSDGKSSELKVFDGRDYSMIKTIPLAVGGDTIAYDSRNRLLYIANGGEDAKMDHALLSVVDPTQMTKIADIAISGTGLEGIAIDEERERLYVSIYNASTIGVVDLRERRQIASWKLPEGDHAPHGLAIDAASHRLYITCRENLTTRERPVGMLFVLDTLSGRAVASKQIGGWADEVALDQKRRRIYVTSGAGWINSFHIDGKDSYTRLPDVETPLISKHGFYSNELDRLFVDTPTLALTEAQVLVFKPMP